ncbi:ABC transporter substrate-binding protein [Agrobacterium sp. LAD9]|uniref:ABC transporter substrate-binding protein n=1 Tax=Agrobacterium sp. LAD9 TaxID=2055153 RepID=UPI000D1EF322|nr:ABC transporter substrate-binding protein [Agrobacterium sp. LAD9]
MTDVNDNKTIGISRRSVLRGATGLATLAGSAAIGAFPLSSPLAAEEAPKPGGRLIVGIIGAGKAESLNPAVSANRQDLPRLWNLYDNLFRRGDDGRAQPLLLEEAIPSADNKVWMLMLRDGVTWHDGSKATAEDLLYSIKTWSDPKHAGHGGVKAIIDFAGVRKTGPLSVEVPLHFGVREFPSTLTMVSFALVKEGVDNSKNPIGTGPFKFVSFTPGVRSVYKRHNEYWNGAPLLEELVIDTSFTDESARLNALLAGKIHAVDQLPYALAKINKSSRRITILNSAGPSFQAFVFRLDVEPFKDVRVRQALRLIPDRQALVDSALNGFGSPGNDLQGKGLQFFADDFVRERDVDKARWFLKEAGHADFTVTLDAIGADPSAILFQQQAKAAGVTVNVNSQDASTFWSNYLQQPLYTTSWDTPLTSLSQWYLTTLFSGARFPETRYGDEKTDKLLFDAIAETDDGRAADKWHALQQAQFDHGGYVSWANANYVDAIAADVRGVKSTRAGSLGGYNFTRAWIA